MDAPLCVANRKRIGFRHVATVLAFGAASIAGRACTTSHAADSRNTSISHARDLLLRGEYEQASADFEQLIAKEKDPSDTLEAALGLARCRLETGRYDQAIQGLVALEADGSSEWHFLLARLYWRVGQYEDLLTHTRRAIQLRSDHAGARFLLGRAQEFLGRRDRAIETYRWFDQRLAEAGQLPQDAQWLTDTGRGLLRYSILSRSDVPRRARHVLHEMYQPAYERVDRTYWPARIAAADLLRQRFNNDDEDGSISDYEAALRINPKLCEAFVGLGAVALESWGFEEVERWAGQALEVNPNFAPAHHLLGRKLILERRYPEAIQSCDRALTVNPNDVIALSIRAAAHACQYDQAGVDQMIARVSSINPACAVLYRTLGDALAGIRQYADSERAYRRAIEVEPTDPNTHTELGMMYMQWGLEDRARDALDVAWALDPFNQRTKFTLDLLDMLQRFDRVETEHFVIRYDDRHDPGLGDYIAASLEEIYEEVTGDYDTPLETKTIVEVFPTHREFSVRITGKPWIHTVGACTGRVIALTSPRESPKRMGPFNLLRVLKHEFTHTVTLAATRQRIPHWFTEGLAVYGEDAPRSHYWCRLLADSIRRDRLFTLESIDWGFIRPQRPTDRTLAYAQSEWMCEYIVDRFGYETIQLMLARFRRGQTQDAVFKQQLGTGPKDFDRDFRAWAQKRARSWCFDLTPPEDVLELEARTEQAPEDAGLHGRLARARLDDGSLAGALTAARRALELDKKERNALEVLVEVLDAEAQQEENETARRQTEDEALTAAHQLAEVAPNGWLAPKLLARIALRRGNLDQAIEPLRRLQRLCPIDPASWRGLAGIYLKQGNDDQALRQLLELARIEEADADLRSQLARIHNRRDQLFDARYWYHRALDIDPFNVSWHRALGDLNMRIGDSAEALREYRMLTRLEPTVAAHFASAAFAAHKLGDAEAAQRHARQAVALDAGSPAKTLLP